MRVKLDEGGSSSKPNVATRFVLFREPVVCLLEYPMAMSDVQLETSKDG